MESNERCLKCRSCSCEIKTIALPTKTVTGVKISLDTFYLKICQNCGYTEMYSAKIIEKVQKTAKSSY